MGRAAEIINQSKITGSLRSRDSSYACRRGASYACTPLGAESGCTLGLNGYQVYRRVKLAAPQGVGGWKRTSYRPRSHPSWAVERAVGRARLGFGGSTRAGGTARRGWRCKCRTGRIYPSAGPQLSSSAKTARQLLLRGSNGEGQGTWSREAPVTRFGARPLNHGPKNGRAAKFGVVTSWHGIFNLSMGSHANISSYNMGLMGRSLATSLATFWLIFGYVCRTSNI